MIFDKAIFIVFPAYTGGKFIQNCLSLSNQVMLPDLAFANLELLLENKNNIPNWNDIYKTQLLNYCKARGYDKIAGTSWPTIEQYAYNNFTASPEIIDEITHNKNFYYLQQVDRFLKYLLNCDNVRNFKLHAILQSVPDSSDLSKWSEHEFAMNDLIGTETFNTDKFELPEEFKNVSQINQKKKITFATHYSDTVMAIKNVCKSYKVIVLENYSKFQTLASQIKNNRDFDKPGLRPTYKEIDNFYSFDVDKFLYSFDEHKIFEEIVNIYNYCELTVPGPELEDDMKKYIRKYIQAHQQASSNINLVPAEGIEPSQER